MTFNPPWSYFWDAFGNLLEVTVSFVMSVCLPVRPSVCLPVRMEQLDSHWTDFHEVWYLSIRRKSADKIFVWLKSDKNGTVSFVMSLCLFVRPSVCPPVRMEQLGSHWTDFHEVSYLIICRKSADKIFFWLKSDKNGTVSFVMSLCLFVRPSVCPPVWMEQLDSQWTDFHEVWYLSIRRKSADKIFVWFKSDKNGTLREDLCTFMIVSRWILNWMRNVSDKICRGNQNT